jgi:hypothetical protein
MEYFFLLGPVVVAADTKAWADNGWILHLAELGGDIYFGKKAEVTQTQARRVIFGFGIPQPRQAICLIKNYLNSITFKNFVLVLLLNFKDSKPIVLLCLVRFNSINKKKHKWLQGLKTMLQTRLPL